MLLLLGVAAEGNFTLSLVNSTIVSDLNYLVTACNLCSQVAHYVPSYPDGNA